MSTHLKAESVSGGAPGATKGIRDRKYLKAASKAEAFARWRRANAPRMRRRRPVGIVVSTSCRRVYECLRGEAESCSNRWPVTRRVREFEARHNAECVPEAARA